MDISNIDPATFNSPSKELSPNDTDLFDDEERSFERKFGKIVKFLWAVVHHPEPAVKGVPMVTCNTPSTNAWLEKVHNENLLTHLPNFSPPAPTLPPGLPLAPQTPGDGNVASSLSKLATTLDLHYENELKQKEEKRKEKKEKHYENLIEVQKRIICLMTTKHGMTDADVPLLEPTETMRCLLEQNSSIRVQAQLQHEFATRDHMCALSPAMCTAIKQGMLASQPTHTDINGLSPFFTPNKSKENSLDQASLLYMSEQMSVGKINADDLKQITKLKITFPKDFNTYLHYLKNFLLLITLLAGEESILSLAIKEMVDHAKGNEVTYHDHQEEWTFYPSVLDHIHRRVQMFLHSASSGKISKLRIRQIDFSFLIDSIEGYTYHYHAPKWLKASRKRSFDEVEKETPTGGGPSSSSGRPNNKNSNDQQKRENKRGEKVMNGKLDDNMKIPGNLKYGEIFHPDLRKNVPVVNHDDGTVKCNNFHHRGFCYTKCKFKASHNKTLSENELLKMRKYRSTLIEKWKQKNGENN